MRTVFFIPPLSRMSGGLATLYSLADTLQSLGHAVAFTCPNGKAAGLEEALQTERLKEFSGTRDVLAWDSLSLAPGDIWLVPESWPNAISAGVTAGAQTVVYAQSWNFLLTTLPQGVQWKQLPVKFLAVSHPVRWFMEQVLSVPVLGILPSAIAPLFFEQKQMSAKPAKRVRVAWMPRKNKVLGEQIQQVALAALAQSTPAPAVDWVPIQNCTLPEVAALLASCHIFLATAFPEGFGLPPLEAMACGCVPVGFTGFGGWEYMRQATALLEADTHTFLPSSALYTPHFPLQEKNWQGNGLFFADGDIMAAGLGLAAAIRNAATATEAWQTTVAAGRTAAEHYSCAARTKIAATLWEIF